MARTKTAASVRMLAFLQSGRNLTKAAARRRFGIQNVSARISELRSAGYRIESFENTTAAGRVRSRGYFISY